MPGTHCPVHPPPTHAELTHAAGAPYAPLALQVSIPLFAQVVVVGVHEPMQAPLTHA